MQDCCPLSRKQNRKLVQAYKFLVRIEHFHVRVLVSNLLSLSTAPDDSEETSRHSDCS
jgi:hypothetical protein